MSRTRMCVLALLFGLGCVLVPALVDPTSAYACSCAETTAARALRSSDAVFRGTVTQADPVKRDGQRVDLRFEVDAVYKGEVYADQVVATAAHEASCGLETSVGSRWVIFAVQNIEGEGDDAVTRLVTDLCRGNLASGRAPAALGAARPPVSGASDREERSVRADRRVTRGVLVAGFGFLGLGVVGALALGLAWRPGSRPKG
ncbi:MAG TPA: hypothetical protein VIT20_01430 [Propionibacteriaceae bacterium]